MLATLLRHGFRLDAIRYVEYINIKYSDAFDNRIKTVYILLGDTGKISGGDNIHFHSQMYIYLVIEKRNPVKCKIILTDINI